MSSYATFSTSRTIIPDQTMLLPALKSAVSDPTAVLVLVDNNTWRGKKASPWTTADIVAAQNLLDATPALTPQLAAQRTIDSFPIEFEALVLALIDQLNAIRAALPTPLPPITPAQALAAVRAKAGTL